jgi:hypothetical protein
MKAKKITLAANAATAFEFDKFYGKSVIVKNMTAGAIQFCDGPFTEAEAAVIPPFGWQIFDVTLPYGETPNFYVKAAAAGDVEIDFGSGGAGAVDAYAIFNAAGMIPHVLYFSAEDDTTLTAELVRLHGETLDLDTPVSLATGAAVHAGDVIKFTAACSAEHYDAQLTVNGVEIELAEGVAYYTVESDTLATVDKVLTDYTLTLTQGAETTLTATLKRESGAEEDLDPPVALETGDTVHAGDIVTIAAAATEEGYHATLTVNETPTELTDGEADVEIGGDTTAVSAAEEDL